MKPWRVRQRKNRILIGVCAAACLLFLRSTDAAAQEQAAQAEDAGTASRTVAGTVVLLGAGAYTGLRIRRKEQKEQEKREKTYVYFENHTQNGTAVKEEKYSL